MCKHWASFALDISMSLQQNIAMLMKPCIHSLKKTFRWLECWKNKLCKIFKHLKTLYAIKAKL